MSIAEPVTTGTLRTDKIRTVLAEAGYRWVCLETTAHQFRGACEALGEIIYEADVRMGCARPRYYQAKLREISAATRPALRARSKA